MYVDDLVSSFYQKNEILSFQDNAIKLFQEAGMNMSKWVTSCPEIQGDTCQFNDKHSVLGLSWDRSEDTLSIQYSVLQ